MNQFSKEEFDEIKKKGEELYKSFEEVYCPYFKEKVYFNTRGFEHLKFKNRDRPRSDQDQYMRYKLLRLAPEILKLSRTLQGVRERKHFEQIRIHGRTDNILKHVTYFEFIAVLGRNRVRVIVKQIENGRKFFWSIIPFWGMNTTTMSRILHNGNPEED